MPYEQQACDHRQSKQDRGFGVVKPEGVSCPDSSRPQVV